MIIEPRSLFIDDKDIIARIGSSNISFILHKDPSGDMVIVAIKDECGRRVYGKRRRRVNTPSLLKQYTGMEMLMYTEKIRPLSLEAFRVRPVGFNIDGGRNVRLEPYLTDTCITVPQMYVNTNVDIVYNGLGISFQKTDLNSIGDGYIIAEFKDLSDGKNYVDEYRVRECGSGLRTGKLSHLIDFLERNAKNLNDYSYKGTMDNMMFFKEER